jgi:hypothetical protein
MASVANHLVLTVEVIQFSVAISKPIMKYKYSIDLIAEWKYIECLSWETYSRIWKARSSISNSLACFSNAVLMLKIVIAFIWEKGEGHYYENQNIENQKEHRKNCKASEHRKCLWSWSEHRKSKRSEHRKWPTYGVWPS